MCYNDLCKMGYYNFKQDLAIAQKTEIEVAEILRNRFNAIILEYHTKYSYDIKAKIHGFKHTFEIKEDFLCAKTGNIAIEYESRGKPSGISTSLSEYFIYKVHIKQGIVYLMVSSYALRQMIQNKKYKRSVVGGDANSNTKMYLFSYKTFRKHSVLLKEIINQVET